jgi:hypothetical protein
MIDFHHIQRKQQSAGIRMRDWLFETQQTPAQLTGS